MGALDLTRKSTDADPLLQIPGGAEQRDPPRRHAAASVALRQAHDGLLLAVSDDGAGFDPCEPGEGRHLGLASMQERVALVNGTLEIESSPGQGTSVIAWVPAEEGAG